MKFDQENKVLVYTMDEKESVAFIKFLYSECLRHEQDIAQARELMGQIIKRIEDGRKPIG